MNIEFDVTLQCNFSCLNCNRHSNFNDLVHPFDSTKRAGVNLYQNTDVTMEMVESFVTDVQRNGTVKRIHLIGGEPLVHPKMGEFCDYIREHLLGIHVPKIFIISNIHPKMLKANVLDTPDDILRYFPFDRIESIDLEYFGPAAKFALPAIKQILDANSITISDVLSNDEIKANIFNLPIKDTQKVDRGTLGDILRSVPMFHGIGVTNFTPLSNKSDVHRCSLVAPFDSGQEVTDTCTVPSHCGVNYSFDGYWPCSNGSAIARLFGLTQYNRKNLPDSIEHWSGIDSSGSAVIKSDGMWDLCKLCQLSAKHPLAEKEHGRPISISYRRALGMENEAPVSDFVVPAHPKKLAKSERIREDN